MTFGVQFGPNDSFREARFDAKASFGNARFGTDADFLNAEFGDNAYFIHADFGDRANFGGARFGDNAYFLNADFGDDANFFAARFGDNANFSAARFGAEANFFKARFGDNATFRFAQFGRGMRLNDADLSNANLRNVSGLILDDTRIRGARFSPQAKDPWSELRQTYTGPKMIFILLLLALFFTPYLLRTAGWVGVHHSQERLTVVIEELHERHAEGTQPLREDFRADLNAIEALLPTADSERWRERWVLSLVMGLDRHWGYVILAGLLIVYNIVRGGLTLLVAPMRDEEERSGHSPSYSVAGWEGFRAAKELEEAEPLSDNQKRWRAHARKLPIYAYYLTLLRFLQWLRSKTETYGWLIPFHRAANVLWVVAVAAFIYNAYLWLFSTVYIPIF